MLIQFLHAPDDGQPDGGDTDGGGAVRASDVLNRYGKNDEAALRLAEKLAEAENTLYKLREKNRALRQDHETLKAKLPADGAVVLAPSDVADLEAYRALGTPATLKQTIEAKTAADGELSTLRRDATLRDVQEATGFDRDVLRDIGADAWQYTIKHEQVDGKDARRVYVTDGDAETLIEEHPKIKKFLPSLKPAAEPRQVYDINAGARGTNTNTISDDDRQRAAARMRATF